MNAPAKPIILPAVPEFLSAIGFPLEEYPGVKRVGVYWGAGDEAYWTIGKCAATGEWGAYLLYMDHFWVTGQIREDRFLLGASDAMETHYMVIDLETSRGYILPIREANEVLMSQWEDVEFPQDKIIKLPENAEGMDWKDLEKSLLEQFRSIFISETDIIARMEENHRKYMILEAALNNWKPTA